MPLHLDEPGIRKEFASTLDDPRVKRGLQVLTSDPFYVAFFLMSVSEGEGMGEAGVAAIREEDITRLIQGIQRQEQEEGGHKEGSREVAAELFPQFFDDSEYRYASQCNGRDYYVSVLQQNREHLKERGLASRLNLYLTTTFGYEVMVVLLYNAVIEAVEASSLPAQVRRRVVAELHRILGEEETHLGIDEQHNALLAADRTALSPRAVELLEALEKLGEDDYRFAAELSMREIARWMGNYGRGEGFRREIEAGAAAARA